MKSLVLSLATLSIATTLSANDSGAIHGPVPLWTNSPESSVDLVWLEEVEPVRLKADTWTLGYGGFGFGDNDDFTHTGKARSQSIYIRRTINIGDWADGRQLIARVRYDDGLIAYVNGKESLRLNVRSGSSANTDGIESHEALDYEEYTIGTFGKKLPTGELRIAVEAHNREESSSDMSVQVQLIVRKINKNGEQIDHVVLRDDAPWECFAGKQPEEDWTTHHGGLDHYFKNRAARFAVSITDEDTLPVKNAEIAVDYRPFGNAPAVAWSAKITGLNPATRYRITLKDRSAGKSNTELFVETSSLQMPSGGLKFVTGGDMAHSPKLLDAMNARCGKLDPHFALLGGDLAYANSVTHDRWYWWLDSWRDHAVTPDGRTVPMVVAIGNHEVQPAEQGLSRDFAPLFNSLFPLPDNNTAYSITFGDYLALVQLDSGHSQPVSAQTDWLKSELTTLESAPWLFVCYHKPTFGTGVKADNTEVRSAWCPLFEKHKVDAVFENDHHVLKRTTAVTSDGTTNPVNGIPYFGDGAWGVNVRSIPDSVTELDYMAHSESTNHLWLVELNNQQATLTALSANGETLDRATIPVTREK